MASSSDEHGVALVTGASRGIGATVATRLAADGWAVAVAARSGADLAGVARDAQALPVSLDVARLDSVEAAVGLVESELGPVTLLVNNAGTGGGSGVTWEKDPSIWWHVFEVNVLGAFLCSQAVLPGMCDRRAGRIVNIASNAAFFPLTPDWDARIDSAYQASKAALIRLSETLAAEAHRYGVQVFAISPGMVKTAMTEPIFADIWDAAGVWSPPERTAELVASIASGALDGLTGRYIHAADDAWEVMPARAAEIVANDLNVLRLRTRNG